MKFRHFHREIIIMKISHWFLIFLLAFGIVTGLVLFLEQPKHPTGMVHPDFKTMAHSGESIIVMDHTKYLAYFFGLGVIGVFGFAVSFGAKKNGQFIGIKPWLFIGLIAYLLMFTLMTVKYWNYSYYGEAGYFAGYPWPTALMLYGLSTVPLILTIVYIVKFKSWVLKEEDEQRFQELVKARDLKEQLLNKESNI